MPDSSCVNPYYDMVAGVGRHPVWQDVSGGVYHPRQLNFPVVTNVRTAFVYSTADSSRPAPVKSRVVGAAGALQANSDRMDIVYSDAIMYYGMHTEVELRLPRTSTWCRATPAFGQALTESARPITLEWNFINNNFAAYQGAPTFANLMDRISVGIGLGELPYLGEIPYARVPCGLKQPAWPFDHLGMYSFVWPVDSEELAFCTGRFAVVNPDFVNTRRDAMAFIPGWIPGYTLKDCVVTFDPLTFEMDITYKIGIATYFLYRMTSHPVAIVGKDAWGNLQ